MDAFKFSFDLVDKYPPEHVIKEAVSKIKEQTNGYVEAHVEPYTGHVSSYTKTVKSSLNAIADVFLPQSEEVTVDIQEELGELTKEKNKYEVYLSVKGLPYYKYRMMIFYYGAISYPVSFVLNSQIAESCGYPYSEEEDFDSMKQVEDMIHKVLDSIYLYRLLQSLINEAIRAENKSAAETSDTNKTDNN
ncbi:MAG: hypothetical protein K6F55_08355 [Eubacterium sp.]|nr:hypothetical protein [Eubacterium sp.]